jgi:hypothetical protein
MFTTPSLLLSLCRVAPLSAARSGSRATAMLLGLATSLAAACTPTGTSGDQHSRSPAPAGRVTNHVLIVSVDGLRPDAIERFGATTIRRLMREGSYAPDAQTVLPSTTLPAHVSMLTGVDPTIHRITWNSDEIQRRGYVRVPTVFGLARAEGLRTAAFFGKSKLNHIHARATLDHVHALDGRLPWQGSGQVTAEVVGQHLEGVRPNLIFVHLAEVDNAGHLYGWMGADYGAAVRAADEAVAALLGPADEYLGRGKYTVILTADHGGHERTHGTDRPEDTTIPWIVWGRGVRGGAQLPYGIRTTATAATALWLLGVPQPSGWSVNPVTQAFDTAAAIPAGY